MARSRPSAAAYAPTPMTMWMTMQTGRQMVAAKRAVTASAAGTGWMRPRRLTRSTTIEVSIMSAWSSTRMGSAEPKVRQRNHDLRMCW